MDVYYSKTFHYRMLSFDLLYDAWISAATDVEKTNLANLDAFQPMLHTIYAEFERYRSELEKRFESLNTEKRERFRSGMEQIWNQYNLLLEHARSSDEDFKVLLDFLKEFPGRIGFILTILASQESEVVAPEPKQFTPTGRFLEGEIYKRIEETGSSQSLFCKAGT